MKFVYIQDRICLKWMKEGDESQIQPLKMLVHDKNRESDC
jgi:hypothetical protein